MSELFDRLPKYVQIKESIRVDIEQGDLKEGHQLPSETALIQRFGASKMTVIRALQELVQEGYLKRLQGKGTYVTRPPHNTRAIGVLVPGTGKGIFPIILHSMEEHIHNLGYDMFLCSTDDDPLKVETFAERLIARQAAGVIAAPLERVQDTLCNLQWFNMFKEAEIPVVLVDRDIPGLDNVPLVQTNNKKVMMELTEEVLKLGHRRILIVRCEDITSTTTDARIEGIKEAAATGKNKAELVEVVSLSENKPFNQMVAELENILCEYEPTVLMSLNDQIAIHVYSLLKNVSANLGDMVSVTGFDDLPFSQTIGLTTVHQPLEEEGIEAVKLLHQLIKGKKAKSKTIKSRIVLRSSLLPIKN